MSSKVNVWSRAAVSFLCGLAYSCADLEGQNQIDLNEQTTSQIRSSLPDSLPSVFGSYILEGSASTTRDGAATYVLPIATPSGGNSVSPSLAISYDSQAEAGMAGWGWRLSGLSSIARCPRRPASHGIRRPVTVTSDDALCLDGQPLLSVPLSARGVQLGAVRELRTEVEDGRRIFAFGNGQATSSASFDFERLLVELPNASTHTFGASRNARVLGFLGRTVEWRLERVESVDGESMLIRYQSFASPSLPPASLEDTEVLPISISYGGNDRMGIAHPYTTRFEYSEFGIRPRSRFSYGARGNTTQTLRAIYTEVTGGWRYPSYHFSYAASPSTGHSLLQDVRVCYDRAEPCQDPIRFDYSVTTRDTQGNLRFSGPSVLADTATARVTYEPFSPTLADVDGDGRDDLVLHANFDGSDFIDLQVAFAESDGRFGARQTIGRVRRRPASHRGLVTDLDGDGKTDFFYYDQTNSAAPRVFLSRGRTFTELTTNAALAGPPQFVDLNRDGRADLLTCVREAWRVRLGTGEGSLNGAPALLFGSETQTQVHCPGSVADTDADGAPDLSGAAYRDYEVAPGTTQTGLLLTRFAMPNGILEQAQPTFHRTWDAGGGFLQSTGPLYLLPSQMVPRGAKIGGDFNGDGISDILIRRGTSGTPGLQIYETYATSIALLKGRSLAQDTTAQPDWDSGANDVLGSGMYSAYNQEPIVGDFDDDGCADDAYVIRAQEWFTGGNDVLIINERHCMATSPTTSRVDLPGRLVVYPDSASIYPADINGDGRLDLVGVYEGGGVVAQTALGSKPDLLVGVRRLSATPLVQFDYTSLNDATVYDFSSCTDTPRTRCVRGASSLVVRRMTLNVPEGNRVTEYRYENARIGRDGIGWLGFQRRVTSQSWLSTTTRETWDTTTELGGRFPFASTRTVLESATTLPEADPNHRVRSTLVRTYPTFVDLGSRRYRVDVDAEQQSTYSGAVPIWSPGSQVTLTHVMKTVTRRDVRGLPEEELTVSSNTDSTLTVRTFQHLEQPWVIGLERTRQVTSRTGTVAATQRSERVYDALGRLSQVRYRPASDPRSIATSFAYDARGRLQTRVDGVGRPDQRLQTWNYQTTGAETIVTYTNPSGHVSQSAIHPLWGAPRWELNANGERSDWGFDGFGRVVEALGPDGRRTWVTYEDTTNGSSEVYVDAPGQAYAERTVADGSPTRVDYFDRLGRPVLSEVQAFDGTSKGVVYGYDVAGRLTAVSQPRTLPIVLGLSTPSTHYSYDNLGRLIRTLEPDGSVVRADETIQVSGSVGRRVITRFDRLNRASLTVLDTVGRAIEFTDANGGVERHAFGPFGSPIRVVDATGAVSTARYDDYGFRVAAFDPSTGQESFVYNPFGELVGVWRRTDGMTTFVRDSMGRVTEERTSRGRVANFRFDFDVTCAIGDLGCAAQKHSLGRLARATSLDGHALETSYDAFGRLTEKRSTVQGAAYREAVQYDSEGRVSTITYPASRDGTTFSIRYRYNNGWLASVANANDGYTYWQRRAVDDWGHTTEALLGNDLSERSSFDSLGRLSGQSTVAPSGTRLRDLAYDWDRENNLLARRDLQQSAGEYFRYDRLDRLEQSCLRDEVTVAGQRPVEGVVGQWPPTGFAIHLNGVSYKPSVQPGSAAPAPWAAGAQVQTWLATSVATTRDAGEMQVLAASGVSLRTDGGLFGASRSTARCSTYSYDAIGNLTTRTEAGSYRYPGRTASGRSLPHAPSSVGGLPVTYDDAGQTLSVGGETYAYDELGRMTAASPDNAGPPTRFEYGPDGSRVLKRARDMSVVSLGSTFEEVTLNATAASSAFSGTAGYSAYRVRVEGRTVAEVRHMYQPLALGTRRSGTPWGISGGLDPAAFSRLQARGPFVSGTRTVSYFHHDHIGSPVLVTDLDGKVVERRSYEAFGLSRSASWRSGVVSTAAPSARSVGFTGHRDDSDVGLVDMGGRMYHPRLARFMSPDLIVQAPGSSQSAARYAYVWNRPLSATDPSGFAMHLKFTEGSRIEASRPKAESQAAETAPQAPAVRHPLLPSPESASPVASGASAPGLSRQSEGNDVFRSLAAFGVDAYSTYKSSVETAQSWVSGAAQDVGDYVHDGTDSPVLATIAATGVEFLGGKFIDVVGVGLLPESLVKMPVDMFVAGSDSIALIKDGLEKGNLYTVGRGAAKAAGVVGSAAAILTGAAKRAKGGGGSSSSANGGGGGGVPIKELKPLDGPGHARPRPELQKLSDAQLLDSARTPADGRGLVRDTRSGRLLDGNGRAHELQRRAADPNSAISPDDLVPVTDYTPDTSMFWDL